MRAWQSIAAEAFELPGPVGDYARRIGKVEICKMGEYLANPPKGSAEYAYFLKPS